MNAIVAAAADAALKAAYPDALDLKFEACGDAADTAFSGSAVLELRVTASEWRSSPLLERVVLKHSVVRCNNLRENAKEMARTRAKRNDDSSKNEVAFLEGYGRAIAERGCRVPRTLAAFSDKEGCTLLMESLAGWRQLAEVPPGPCTDAVLRWLARFHASCLPAAVGGGALPLSRLAELGGWARGTHVEVGKRPPADLAKLPKNMAEFCARFEAEDPYFASAAARAQGARLQTATQWVAKRLMPGQPHTTMVHGDYKQGNFFFDDADECAIIDWQWTGPGLGATDLIYVCAMALSDEVLADYEADVVRVYHKHLCEALGGDRYPYSDLLREFKVAALDYARWQGGSRLPSITPENVRKAQQDVDVNHGIYRRSVPRLVWTFKLVDACLDDFEAGRLNTGYVPESPRGGCRIA